MQSMPKIFIHTDLSRKSSPKLFNNKCLEMDAIIKRFEDVGEKI